MNDFPPIRSSRRSAIVAGLTLSLALFPGRSVAGPAERGPQIVAAAFSRLSAALGAALADGGPAKALGVCSDRAPAIAAEVATEMGVTIRRASLRPRNPQNAAAGDERDVLAGFAAAMADGGAAIPVVREGTDGSRIYFAPIVLANPLCLQCHGQPGTDVAAATLSAIRARYPQDQATGYRLGELRGLWRITFPQSQPSSPP